MNIAIDSTNVSPRTGGFIMLAVSVMLAIAAYLTFRHAEKWQQLTTSIMGRSRTSKFERVMHRAARNFGTAFLTVSSLVIFGFAIKEIIAS
ncbi:MAG TPA: hypothetical protein VIV12_00790 [Streptosporangiaceae bacterium]